MRSPRRRRRTSSKSAAMNRLVFEVSPSTSANCEAWPRASSPGACACGASGRGGARAGGGAGSLTFRGRVCIRGRRQGAVPRQRTLTGDRTRVCRGCAGLSAVREISSRWVLSVLGFEKRLSEYRVTSHSTISIIMPSDYDLREERDCASLRVAQVALAAHSASTSTAFRTRGL